MYILYILFFTRSRLDKDESRRAGREQTLEYKIERERERMSERSINHIPLQTSSRLPVFRTLICGVARCTRFVRSPARFPAHLDFHHHSNHWPPFLCFLFSWVICIVTRAVECNVSLSPSFTHSLSVYHFTPTVCRGVLLLSSSLLHSAFFFFWRIFLFSLRRHCSWSEHIIKNALGNIQMIHLILTKLMKTEMKKSFVIWNFQDLNSIVWRCKRVSQL